MSSTKYIVLLGDNKVLGVAIVNSDRILNTSRTFRWHRIKFDENQRLELDIGAKLYSSIGETNEGDTHKLAIIAAVFDLATTGRDVKAATQYIRTDEGQAWLNKLVVPETLDMIQEVTDTGGSSKVQPDSRIPHVPQYVNLRSMAQMEDASQQEGPDSDAAAALEIPGMEVLVILLASIFLVTIFMILTAMPN